MCVDCCLTSTGGTGVSVNCTDNEADLHMHTDYNNLITAGHTV